MLLFGHLGVTLGVFFVLAIFIPRLRTTIEPKYLVIGVLLPDLIDKTLGKIIFASTFANGRIIAHTLLFFLALILTALYFYKKRGDLRIICLTIGSFFHLIEDRMWANPITLFWPFLGLRFPKDCTDYTGLEYLIRMLKKSFKLSLSHSSIPEILGTVIIVILTLYWLTKRFGQKKI